MQAKAILRGVISYDKFHLTQEFGWMRDNCYKYGFILRYDINKENIIPRVCVAHNRAFNVKYNNKFLLVCSLVDFIKNRVTSAVNKNSKLYSLASCAKYILNELIAVINAHSSPAFSFFSSLPTKNIVIMLIIDGNTDDNLSEISVSPHINIQALR